MKIFTLLAIVLVLATFGFSAQIMPPVGGSVSISGTVTDDPYPMKRASMALSGVSVKLWTPLYVMLNQAADILPPYPLRQLVDSATTDAQGKFAFKPATAASYQISFDNPNYVSRTIDLYAARDTSIAIQLLAKGAMATVAGTIWTPCPAYLNCVRQPVQGCTVTVNIGGYSLLAKAEVSVMPIYAVTYTAITDAAGHYTIDSLPLSVNNQPIVVTAQGSGFTAQAVDTAIWNRTTTTVDFSLNKVALGTKDTVYVTPVRPTIKDSITFDLFNFNHNCCAVYSNKVISVQDTAIYLSYTIDDPVPSPCMCLVAGSSTQFKSAPLKAGTYGIYKAESPYCAPGTACPAIKIAPQRVGNVTVTDPSSVRAPSAPAAGKLSAAHDARVMCFNARGVLISRGLVRNPGVAGVYFVKNRNGASVIRQTLVP
jgi:hypothetical protein